jgi:hypothetical protein
MRNRQQTIAGLALVILLSSIYVLAQASLGGVSGIVRDNSGAVISGAKVTLSNDATGEKIETKTSSEGNFTFSQLKAASYTVRIEAPSFRTGVYKQVNVDPGRVYSMTAQLQVGTLSESVEVVAGTEIVNTVSSEVTNTIQSEQMRDLPLVNRNPLTLIALQAGVVGNSRTATTINGGRPSWTSVSQDGVNINDNYIRTNAVDFVPNRPSADQVGEFTILTNNEGTDSFGGASQVKFSTKSGTNTIHGNLYEYNRNSALGANSWPNNLSGTPKPFRNQNQFGGGVGGPAIKNRLFYYGYYEGYRLRQGAVSGGGLGNTVPSHPDFFQGTYRYLDATGTQRTLNVLNPGGTLLNLPVDPSVKKLFIDRYTGPLAAPNTPLGTNLNIATAVYNQNAATTRNQWGFRTDFELTKNHHLEYVMQRSKEVTDRTDLDFVNVVNRNPQDGIARFYVGAWRWTISPNLQNEFRAGINDTSADFLNTEDYGGVQFAGLPLSISDPRAGRPTSNDFAGQGSLLPQGRYTLTRQWGDGLSWIHGNHAMKMGGTLQQLRIAPYNFRGLYPVVTFGFNGAPGTGYRLTSADFPGGLAASETTAVSNANALRAFLAGYGQQVDERFQVKSKDSGFVPGYPNVRNLISDNMSFYFTDSWRVRPRLTLTAGLKWEYFSPLAEQDNLQLTPVYTGSAKDALLNPNTTLDFVNGQYWNKDLNNFGPNIGIAWDPFGDGKTAIRAGYTLAFITEDNVRFGQNAFDNNAGLQADGQLATQFFNLSGTVPSPSAVYKVPRTLADQVALSPTGPIGIVDPSTANPYVHELHFGVSREIGLNTAVEVRYVGTLGRELNRTINLNQINVAGNQAFVADYNRARNNYFNCGQVLNATTATCAAAQPLQLLNTANWGSLTSTTVINAVRDRAIGDLANFYIGSGSTPAVRANARSAFLANPGIYEALYGTNGSSTDYHSMQIEVRRRLANGFGAQFNYTWSKLLSDALATDQTRTDVFLDNARPQLDRAVSEYDIRHDIKANFSYELPFGRGKKFAVSNGLVDRLISGYQFTSIVKWQGGFPLSINSGRGTFNRATRSANSNTANSSLSVAQIKDQFGIYKIGNSFYYMPSTTFNPSGSLANTAVGSETLAGGNTPGFAGQVFFNPDPLTVGTLPLRGFTGPGIFQFDASVAKRTRITERVNAELRIDMINMLNHPTHYLSGTAQSINSTSFMKLSDYTGPRVIQLGMRVSF